MIARGISPLLLLLLSYLSYFYYDVSAQIKGKFTLLNPSIGISPMHSAVTRYGTVVMLDRTNIGPSLIDLPDGRCRMNLLDLALKRDCTAHSVLFNPGPDTVRPLFILTDTWCSSAAFLPDGTLLQTGGNFEGKSKIRYLRPCPTGDKCDWMEDEKKSLADPRWYATNQLLPDGRVIVVGGRKVFTYEFIPKAKDEPDKFELQFLRQTRADNLYPYVYLLPDGNLFIFANRDSIVLDYKTNRVLKELPTIPGEPRNYPSAGSSVILPLQTVRKFTKVEVMICGGAKLGAFKRPREQLPCSDTCGRLDLTGKKPDWVMETMPFRRCMGDMLLLPTRDVVIINGAANGSQGYGYASQPVLNPVIYRRDLPEHERFLSLAPATIPRMYHSTANLLPDGRVLLAGSNTHALYTFTGEFPTELRVEAWSAPYLDRRFKEHRPTKLVVPRRIRYQRSFNVSFRVTSKSGPKNVEINLVSAPFVTHSFAQGQRLVRLTATMPMPIRVNHVVTVQAPLNSNIAPPSYYMLFVVNDGIPSKAVWVRCF